MIQAFCDESHDERDRVFTLAGFIGDESEWALLADKWQERCTKDGVDCYHASDCAGQWKDFAHLSDSQCIALNTDLITYMTETRLKGFAISISIPDFVKVSQSGDKARGILGPSPYFLGMQMLLLRICEDISVNNPDEPMPFVFDRNEAVSGEAKRIWDDLRAKNPRLATYMRSLTYEDKQQMIPLQVADELAFEAMKNAIAWAEERPDRRPILRMKEAGILHSSEFLGRDGLEEMARNPAG